MSHRKEEFQSERKNRSIAAILTIALHIGAGIFLLSVVAWRAPDPPLPDTGIELSLGLLDAGAGDAEPAAAPETPVQSEPNQDPQPTEEKVEDVDPEPVVTSPVESPVKAPEKPKVRKEPDPKPVEKPVEKPVQKAEEKVPEPKKAVDPKLAYNPDAKNQNNAKGLGEISDNKGNQGSPEGKIDAKALYGEPGGGGAGTGTGLSLAGWAWDRKPNPKMPEHEQPGRVVFKLKVDEEGNMVELTVIQNSLSPTAVKACRAEIEKLNFVQVGSGTPKAAEGRITIEVTATQ